MTTSAPLLERAVAPLDAARRRVFVGASRTPWLGRVVTQRDTRLLAQSCTGVVALFAATLAWPGGLLVLGPALFGVAHVASDVRYLALRRDVPRTWASVVAIACCVLVVARIAEALAPLLLPYARIEAVGGWGLALAGAFAGATTSRSWRRLAMVALPLALTLAAAAARPTLARLAFSYAHNVVALVLWVILFRRRRIFAIPALVLATLGAAVLTAGSVLKWVRFSSAFGMHVVEEALAAVPHGTPQRLALGLGLSYLFLQATHYSVWLFWIPQEDLRGEGTLSFRGSLRALVRDFGSRGLTLVVLAAVVVALASAVAPHRTRGLYLTVAAFHGYLELAMLAFFLARGGRALRAT